MFRRFFLCLFLLTYLLQAGAQDLSNAQKLENEYQKAIKEYEKDHGLYEQFNKAKDKAEAEWKKEKPEFTQEGKHTCGAACAKTVVKELANKEVTEKQMVDDAKTDVTGGGTKPKELSDAMRKNGLQSEVKENINLTELARHVGPDKMAMAWVKIDNTLNHIVLIDAIWQSDGTTLVHVRDPGGGNGPGSNYVMTAEDFNKIWLRTAVTASKPDLPKEKAAGGVKDKTGAYLTPEQLKDYGFAMSGRGLGEVALNCSNPAGLAVEPGTLCHPDDSNYQVMMVVADCEVKGPCTVPAVCIEFHKKVPLKSVTFQPGACPDPRLLNLARFLARQPLGGPWDQGAVWIVTDHLTREEMNKRLVPALSPWTYLRSLRIAGEAGGVDYANPTWRPCLDPSVLLDDKDSERDVNWLVKTFSQVDPTALAQWLEANQPALAALPPGPRTTLATALNASPNEALRAAGARLKL